MTTVFVLIVGVCALLALTASAAVVVPAAASSERIQRHRHVVAMLSGAMHPDDTPEFHADAEYQAHVAATPGAERRHFIVQLAEPLVTSRDIVARQFSLDMTHYLPHNSFDVFTMEDTAHQLRLHPRVVWVGALLPKHKLAPEMLKENYDANTDFALMRPGSPRPLAIVAVLSPDARATANDIAQRYDRASATSSDLPKEAKIADAGAGRRRSIVLTFDHDAMAHGEFVSRTRAAMHWLASHADTRWVELATPWEQHAGETSKLVWLNDATAPSVPSLLDGNNQVVAIGDLGLQRTSPCYNGRVINVDAVPDNDHGTAMAAVCCASGASPGVAPAAKLLWITLTVSPMQDLVNVKQKLASALNNTGTEGAGLFVSGSGNPSTVYSTTSQDIDDFTYANQRLLPIFSSGNSEGMTGAGLSKNALVVGATDLSTPNRVAAFSAKRSTDGRFKPDLVTVGQGLSAGCQNMISSGSTSWSAATMAGVAALVRQYFKEGYHPSGEKEMIASLEPPAPLVKAMLIHSAVPLSSYATSNNAGAFGTGRYPSEFQGFGRPVLKNVLRFCPGGTCDTEYQRNLFVSYRQSLPPASGSFDVTCLMVPSDAKLLKATLVWQDPKATAGAYFTLYNDLDLVLVQQSTGREWRGNGGSNFDRVNNVEQITLPFPEAGNYTLLVFGQRVLETQPFALVITGDFSDTSCAAAGRTLPDPMMPMNTIVERVSSMPKCALGCSGFTAGECTQGRCECLDSPFPRNGVDCSMNTCADVLCGDDGYCDVFTATCVCKPGFQGTKCNEPVPANAAIREIVTTRDQYSSRGRAVGTFVGLVVGMYFLGCCCAIIFGAIGGTKYLEYKRDQGTRA